MSSPPVPQPNHLADALFDTLTEHLAVLSEVERVLQEENQLLKYTGEPPDDGFIRRKSLLLPRLEESLAALRARRGPGERPKPVRDLLREAQGRLHKMFLLDRENETLLLRCAVANTALPNGPVKFGAGQVAKIYGQHR